MAEGSGLGPRGYVAATSRPRSGARVGDICTLCPPYVFLVSVRLVCGRWNIKLAAHRILRMKILGISTFFDKWPTPESSR